MKQKSQSVIATLDIGSSKIVATISEIDEMEELVLLGMGIAPSSQAIRGGVVVNIEATVNAISKAIEDAEIQAGKEIRGLFVGITGGNVESINSKGVVAISGPDKEIKQIDVDRVIDAAKAVSIPMDREVLHIIPQSFIVDGRKNIKYPIGMVGTRLECIVHILTIPISSIQNIIRCIERIGLEVYDIVLQNLAIAKAVFEEDEKEIGSLLIDIGAETSKISIYYQGAPYFHAVYPLGGYLITNDIAAGLKLPLSTAENIKLAYGVTHETYVKKDETLQIPALAGRKSMIIARSNLVHIIRPRVEEIFNFIKHDISQHGYLDLIQGGIVLTGGSALLPGILEVCENVFDIQTRLGLPKKIKGVNDAINSCEHSVSNGIIRWGFDRLKSEIDHTKRDKGEGILKFLKKIFDEFF